METRIAVVIGIDIRKTGHHACALDPDGNKLVDKPLPQDEAQLQELFTSLQKHGEVLMVVDRPNTIGALRIAVARDAGCVVAYPPGLAMRKAADPYPGRSKTDACDAVVIADTARTMPHTRPQIDRENEILSALKVLAGFDEDLPHKTTSAEQDPVAAEADPSRARTSLHRQLPFHRAGAGPAGEVRRLYRFQDCWSWQGTAFRPVPLTSRSRSADRPDLHRARRTDRRRSRDRRSGNNDPQSRWPGQGTERTTSDRGQGGRGHAGGLPSRLGLDKQVQGSPILTAAQILLNIGDGSAFETPGHLAAYAGIAPVTRRSGTSICGEFPARSSNKRLKNALFYSAWVASNHDPISKAYYDRKRAQGKRHNAAVICLTRHRCNVIFPMLLDGTYYQASEPIPTP